MAENCGVAIFKKLRSAAEQKGNFRDLIRMKLRMRREEWRFSNGGCITCPLKLTLLAFLL